MNNSRLFLPRCLLTNGNVFVAGGEYGAGMIMLNWLMR